MAAVAPNSPEARLAARKLLNGFLFLAALNLVVIAIAFWPSGRTESVNVDDVPAMREVLESALNDWQRGDARAFYSHFATANIPPDRPAEFTRIYVDGFGAKYGKLGARKPGRADTESGRLLIDVEFERMSTARLAAEFVRENGRIKLSTLRVEDSGGR